MHWVDLLHNEVIKILRKKRFRVILLILLVLISLFTYAQLRVVQNDLQQTGTTDWRLTLQQKIADQTNRLQSGRLTDDYKRILRITIQQEQYYLNYNIDPAAPGAPTFVRAFLDASIYLFLPLLVVIIAADMVSGEYADGTIKLLLTRPVKRWKILLSKYLAAVLSVSLIVFLFGLLTYLISGIAFGYAGWNLPVLTGFGTAGDTLTTNTVHSLAQWQYCLLSYGLGWFTCLAVGTLSFMLSVLFRTSAAAMGTMLAALIGGSILTQTASSWTQTKYLFMLNLRLTDYLSGGLPPVQGMTLGFSMAVLGAWSVMALVVSFAVFTRKDVF
ncbi:MAG: ABC-type multidrug transport system, permease component [Bacilli bacterium]|nr:ABC-type multidrug transport system, permease component [Bacilli bacterium]